MSVSKDHKDMLRNFVIFKDFQDPLLKEEFVSPDGQFIADVVVGSRRLRYHAP